MASLRRVGGTSPKSVPASQTARRPRPKNQKPKTIEGLSVKWETLAPPFDFQNEKVLELADIVNERPYPSHLTYEDEDEENESQQTKKDGPLCVANANQFLSWFATVESEMETQQESSYRRRLESLKNALQRCDYMISEIDLTIAGLDTLTSQYKFVSAKTESLHTACKSLLSDQQRLLKYAEQVSYRLEYFLELDRATLRLNSPKLSVLSPTFLPLLRSLDKSITYISQKSEYRDSATFLTKFRHLHTKALVFLKLHTYESLKSATNQAKQELSRNVDPFTFLYAKFGVKAPSIKLLMDELETKSETHEECRHVLTDCQNCYFTQRQSLTIEMLRKKLFTLDKQYPNQFPTWIRQGCTFTQRVCQSEYQLYHRFFTSACPELNDFLESLTEVLYNHLRPSIIKLTDIELLAELCDIMHTEILGDQSRQKGGAALPFEVGVHQLLEDIQSRLMYRVQNYIRNDISRYKATDADLDYPNILLENNPTNNIYKTWFPPMHRTLMCLSTLYRCIDRIVFEGISHEAVAICRDLLHVASETIQTKQTSTDGHLFLIKHLLTLREQLAPFDVDFVHHHQALDWQTTKNAAFGLFNRMNTSQLFSLSNDNAFVQFLAEGVPTIKEQTLNSKEEVNMDLKKTCETFFEDISRHLMLPICEFLEQAEKVKDVKTLGSATVDKTMVLAKEGYDRLMVENPKLKAKMNLYLKNPDTEKILYSRIKSIVLDYYRNFQKLVFTNYNSEDQAKINLKSIDHLSLVLQTNQ